MTALLRELTAVLGPGMRVPPELARLYEWITGNGQTSVHGGRTSGWLGGDGETAQVTGIEFRAEGNQLLEHWFGVDDAKVLDRVCVFAATGGDGSMAALWIDDDGGQQIVHMGSGSGSTTVCLLGRTPLEFLRLLAIGYDELCWSSQWGRPPVDEESEDEEPADTDSAYRRWLVGEFGVTIPAVATELATRVEMGDSDPSDPFARWVETVTG